MSTTTNTTATTKKEARVADNKKRVSAGVIALGMFAGWMAHAAEVAKPGIIQEETGRAGNVTGGAVLGVVDAGRNVAAQSGLGNVLTAPVTVPAGQLGGVSNGGQ